MGNLDEETITRLVVEIFASAGDFGKGKCGPGEEERKERCPHIRRRRCRRCRGGQGQDVGSEVCILAARAVSACSTTPPLPTAKRRHVVLDGQSLKQGCVLEQGPTQCRCCRHRCCCRRLCSQNRRSPVSQQKQWPRHRWRFVRPTSPPHTTSSDALKIASKTTTPRTRCTPTSSKRHPHFTSLRSISGPLIHRFTVAHTHTREQPH